MSLRKKLTSSPRLYRFIELNLQIVVDEDVAAVAAVVGFVVDVAVAIAVAVAAAGFSRYTV